MNISSRGCLACHCPLRYLMRALFDLLVNTSESNLSFVKSMMSSDWIVNNWEWRLCISINLLLNFGLNLVKVKSSPLRSLKVTCGLKVDLQRWRVGSWVLAEHIHIWSIGTEHRTCLRHVPHWERDLENRLVLLWLLLDNSNLRHVCGAGIEPDCLT